MSYSLSYDLLVDEDEIKNEANAILNNAKCFELQLEEIARYIDNIAKHAIIQGNASENIKLFRDEVNGLKDEATKIAEDVVKIVNNYVTSIDKADDCVY